MTMTRTALFDIGNTSLKCAIAIGGTIQHIAAAEHAALSSRKLKQMLKRLLATGEIDGAIACCVAPDRGRILKRAWSGLSTRRIVFLNHQMKMPISLKGYPRAATIGADRLASASASYARCRTGHIVIDAGTAATVDCVSADGVFLGGAIAPGPEVMQGYLSAKTGLLPDIEYGGAIPKVGRSTSGAMKIGVRVGYASLLQGIVEHLGEGAFGSKSKVPIVVTGGHAKRVADGLTADCQIIRNLTLSGLALIYNLNL